jgi:glutathione synthase/RimK-type ligase-like ATP-grasp enzyme
MPDVLLATCVDLPAGDEDGDALSAELDRRGVTARWVPWTAWHELPAASADTLTVIRSTWDYTAQRQRFLDWTRGVRRIANDADVVAWNTDKTYLADLAGAGVPTVPTTFAAPGAEIELPDADEYVVKPSVGAGSRGAGRFTHQNAAAARAHAATLHAAGRTVMVQPYLAGVDDVGETTLVYFDGRFSHAVRKGAMLPTGTAHAVDAGALFVAKNITACRADAQQIAVGAATLGAVRDRFGADQLYTRVDLLPSPDGPVVIEVELTEPSLFLGYGAVERDEASPVAALAAAIAERV